MTDDHYWEAGTWEGARKTQIERALRLTVRERLEALEALSETSERLVAAGREASSGAGLDGPVISLDGCRPTPLAVYLKALGILRLVAEQKDPEARGWWRDDTFQLKSHLDREELVAFFRDEYRPTPILAPWNGGSGFYPKDNKSGIEPIESGWAGRFEPLRRSMQTARWVVTDMGLTEKPDSRQKEELLVRLRSELDEKAIVWMDAAVLLTEESPRYPPLLGTGGNDGRLEFTNNFLQRLVELFDPETGEAEREADLLLKEALFGHPIPEMRGGAIGQFFPGAAGGPNASTGFEGSTLLNPWDYILMLEGAVLFAAVATRRLEASGESALSYPFTVKATGAGSGGTSLADEGAARGEIWMPLWTQPASLPEIQQLLGEGRATVRGRAARDGLDFARAVATLGVTRGIAEFQRFGFLQRYGRTYLATPLNRVRVRPNPTAELIDQLERHQWLRRFRRLGRDKAPARVASLARRLEDALFELALRGSPEAVQRTLIVLGEIMHYLAVSPSSRERCRPVPMLESNWIEKANDGTSEFELALALAGLHAVASPERGGAAPLPMIVHLAPVRADRRQSWEDEPGREVVWGPRSLEENLRLVLQRRLLVAAREDHEDRPLDSWATAPASAVADWLGGHLDTERLHELLPGLALCRVPSRGLEGREEETPLLPGAFRLLKPFFCTLRQLQRVRFLPEDEALPLPPELVRHLAANRVDRAVEIGVRTLRARGFPVPRHLHPRFPDGPKLLSTLMVPLEDRDVRKLIEPFRKGSTEKEDPSNTETDHAD